MKFTTLFAIVFATALAAQDAKPAPTYLGRRIAQTMHWMGAEWLTRHEREKEESTELMRKQLMLKPGMNVCDMGCGNGYHTIPMAKAIAPDGKAYAVDIQKEMLTFLEERAKTEKVANIVPVLNTEVDPKLPAASCDLILLVDVYHEFSKPKEMLEGMKKALKPKGQLVFVEFRGEDDKVPIKPEHKMTKAQVTKELEASGFKLARSFDELPWQHMLFFEVDDKVVPTSK